MKYSKLPVVLLSKLQASQKDDVNAIIVSYLLENIDKDITVQRIAKDCNVGIATVSRFVRNLGVDDFGSLKRLLNNEWNTFSQVRSLDELKNDYFQSIQNCIDSIDINVIKCLCKSIHDSKNVYVFGLLKAQSAAITLQADLYSLGKPTYSFIQYKEQIEAILKSTREDCVVIFSDTSSYFEYFDIRSYKEKLKYTNIWMIGSGKKDEYIQHHISYQKPGVIVSHPIQLLFVADMISQCYADLYK